MADPDDGVVASGVEVVEEEGRQVEIRGDRGSEHIRILHPGGTFGGGTRLGRVPDLDLEATSLVHA